MPHEHKTYTVLLGSKNQSKPLIGQKHAVWKSQKKSHSTLGAKRATFTFWVDKSWFKMPKMVNLAIFLKTWGLRWNSVTRQARQVSLNRTKIGGKCQNYKNSNATFWVIFKQFAMSEITQKMFIIKWNVFEFSRLLKGKMCCVLPFERTNAVH